MTDITAQKLTDFSLFHGLGGDELALVAGIVRTEMVEAGTVIISENERGGDLYLLEDGVVDIQKTLTIITSRTEFGTKDRSFVRLKGLDHCFFGEMVLFGNKERSATVRAVTSCRLYVIRDSDFLALSDAHPRIGYVVLTNIASILSDYLRKANTDILKLTTALSLALSG
jgi:CRP-like cAMP-binding protein